MEEEKESGEEQGEIGVRRQSTKKEKTPEKKKKDAKFRRQNFGRQMTLNPENIVNQFDKETDNTPDDESFISGTPMGGGKIPDWEVTSHHSHRSTMSVMHHKIAKAKLEQANEKNEKSVFEQLEQIKKKEEVFKIEVQK